jgi:hypothetical protein
VRTGRWIAGLAGAILIAALTVGSSAATYFPEERCEYVEAGPPGPPGNRLVVGAGAWLNRHGDKIVVHELFERCTGRQATVHNIDQIVLKDSFYALDERAGAFAPGATRERSGSEIEIRFVGADGMELHEGPGRDTVRIATLDSGRVAFNLNPRADGDAPDYDVTMVGDTPEVVKVEGGRGADVIDAGRLTGMGDNTTLRSRVRLAGGPGDDTILGSPGDEWRLEAGGGDDLVRAGAGDDDISFGRGHDRVYGGPGGDDIYYEFVGVGRRRPDAPDRLYGGPGGDRLSDGNGRADVIRCGSGEDVVDREPHDRGSPDCEQPRY